MLFQDMPSSAAERRAVSDGHLASQAVASLRQKFISFETDDDAELFAATVLKNRESIFSLSHQKLRSPKCSLRRSLLIQSALPLLSAPTSPISESDIEDDGDDDLGPTADDFEEELERFDAAVFETGERDVELSARVNSSNDVVDDSDAQVQGSLGQDSRVRLQPVSPRGSKSPRLHSCLEDPLSLFLDDGEHDDALPSGVDDDDTGASAHALLDVENGRQLDGSDVDDDCDCHSEQGFLLERTDSHFAFDDEFPAIFDSSCQQHADPSAQVSNHTPPPRPSIAARGFSPSQQPVKAGKDEQSRRHGVHATVAFAMTNNVGCQSRASDGACDGGDGDADDAVLFRGMPETKSPQPESSCMDCADGCVDILGLHVSLSPKPMPYSPVDEPAFRELSDEAASDNGADSDDASVPGIPALLEDLPAPLASSKRTYRDASTKPSVAEDMLCAQADHHDTVSMFNGVRRLSVEANPVVSAEDQQAREADDVCHCDTDRTMVTVDSLNGEPPFKTSRPSSPVCSGPRLSESRLAPRAENGNISHTSATC